MANTSMNISLPESMKEWVEHRIDSGIYANNSDYVRDLIREDQVRYEKHQALQHAISQGIASGNAGSLDIDSIKQKARKA